MPNTQTPSIHTIAAAGIAEQAVGPDVKFFYVNSMRAGLTAVDFVLTFGRLVEKSIGHVVAEDQCELRMSPQFFKVMVNQAQAVLAAYEKQFGVVSVPKPTSVSEMANALQIAQKESR